MSFIFIDNKTYTDECKKEIGHLLLTQIIELFDLFVKLIIVNKIDYYEWGIWLINQDI